MRKPRKAWETFTCQQCGADFQRAPADVQRGHTKYCGQACFHKAHVGHPNYNIKPADERTCVVCGKVFLVGGQHRPKRAQTMCSRSCQRRARYRHGMRAKDLSITEAAYIAGIVDGEGFVFLELYRRGVHLRLGVANTDKPLLEWLTEVTGVGNVNGGKAATERHKAGWTWVCASEAAETVLQQIRPYMRIKAERVDFALACQARLRIPAEKADLTWQQEARDKMKAFNKRGPRTA